MAHAPGCADRSDATRRFARGVYALFFFKWSSHGTGEDLSSSNRILKPYGESPGPVE